MGGGGDGRGGAAHRPRSGACVCETGGGRAGWQGPGGGAERASERERKNEHEARSLSHTAGGGTCQSRFCAWGVSACQKRQGRVGRRVLCARRRSKQRESRMEDCRPSPPLHRFSTRPHLPAPLPHPHPLKSPTPPARTPAPPPHSTSPCNSPARPPRAPGPAGGGRPAPPRSAGRLA